MKKRERRRQDLARIKKKVLHHDNCTGQQQNPRRVGRLVHTRHPCSCYMCGNPRKWWDEQTQQEQKFLWDDKPDEPPIRLVPEQ